MSELIQRGAQTDWLYAELACPIHGIMPNRSGNCPSDTATFLFSLRCLHRLAGKVGKDMKQHSHHYRMWDVTHRQGDYQADNHYNAQNAPPFPLLEMRRPRFGSSLSGLG
jgi:hypothetical protein